MFLLLYIFTSNNLYDLLKKELAPFVIAFFFCGCVFFVADQIVQVAQPMLFKWARQLKQCGQQSRIQPEFHDLIQCFEIFQLLLCVGAIALTSVYFIWTVFIVYLGRT